VSKLTLKKPDSPIPDLFSEGEPSLERVDALVADFVNDLNSVQRDAVTTTDGPLLIVAGAGSGKTRVLTYRMAYLLSRGIAPWHILALTFTNKAAAEMKERIAGLVGHERARPLWSGTFHSVFSRILRREAEQIGFTSSFTIYDTDDSLGVIRTAMGQFGISQQDFSPKMILNRISSAKNSMVSPGAFRQKADNPIDEKISSGPTSSTLR
jgi:DNA helicase-2/ATP-dependent DNA helicase PcrA